MRDHRGRSDWPEMPKTPTSVKVAFGFVGLLGLAFVVFVVWAIYRVVIHYT